MQKEIEPALRKRFENRKIGILGFGIEGRSSYKLLRRLYGDKHICIADKNPKSFDFFNDNHDANIQLFTGISYNDIFRHCDFILKSPGVKSVSIEGVEVSSQTEVFTELFCRQIIGVTGTKGKSTTASLIHHILVECGMRSLLTGNIGLPAFDIIDRISEQTIIVYELSAHQLYKIRVSPHIAILLNVYQEHLDHFGSFDEYMHSKYNIFRHQLVSDFFIHWADQLPALDTTCLGRPLTYSLQKSDASCHIKENNIVFTDGFILPLAFERSIPGDHNLLNIMAAVTAALKVNADRAGILSALKSFRGLPHRLENLGSNNNVTFYNDSIATIPEACIHALKTLKNVDTLILGGYDRGIDYDELLSYLADYGPMHIIFTGEAGRRMYASMRKTASNSMVQTFEPNFDDAVMQAVALTPQGGICLLSPAASSYDEFRNFEHRGDRFRELVLA